MLYIDRVGHFYGQCSELCGVNHGFMPIEVYAIPKSEYIWYLTYVCNDFSKHLSWSAYDSFLPFDFSKYNDDTNVYILKILQNFLITKSFK
jgi:hypothetical protein